MSGIEGPVAAGVVKLAIERGGRPGLDKALSLLRGKTLMVVGPTSQWQDHAS